MTEFITNVTTVIGVFTIIGYALIIVKGLGITLLAKQLHIKFWGLSLIPIIQDYKEGSIISELLGYTPKKSKFTKITWLSLSIVSIISSKLVKTTLANEIKNTFNIWMKTKEISISNIIIGILLAFLISLIIELIIDVYKLILRIQSLNSVKTPVIASIIVSFIIPTVWYYFVYFKLRKSNKDNIIVNH